jgi:hypothetical protein
MSNDQDKAENSKPVQQNMKMANAKSVAQTSEMSLFATRLLLKEGLNDRLVLIGKGFSVSLVINGVLAFAVLFQLMTVNVKNHYFTVDPQGRITEVIPMEHPTLTPPALRDWAADCVRSSYTFMFTDYKEALGNSLQRCFTPEGSIAFKEQLSRSGIVKDVVTSQGSLITQIDGIALIKKEGMVDGRKAYQIEVPVKVAKYSPKEQTVVRNWTVMITALRVDNLENDKGMAIHVWGMEPRK